jgi:uncharacterized protein
MMSIWALADLHLSFGIPNKSMDVFGNKWIGYTDKIRDNWFRLIKPDDLVLIPGDISWAMHIEEVKPDLEWIDALPGIKVILRGNHDYWWSSLSKVEKILPPSIHLLQNNVFQWKPHICIAGARLWDTEEYNFGEFIDYIPNTRVKKLAEEEPHVGEVEKIFQRELNRLEVSLKCVPKNSTVRIAMTHYPPISADLTPSRASLLLEKYRINICVFGHLHNVKPMPMFGTKNEITYYLTSCDYLDFCPIKIWSEEER